MEERSCNMSFLYGFSGSSTKWSVSAEPFPTSVRQHQLHHQPIRYEKSRCMLGLSTICVCSKLFAQCINVFLRLSLCLLVLHPVFPLPLPTACLSIHLSPVHNFSSSALWTQVALGHDMLSFHIMVKKATRETERDEEWREDNQCGSPQKLWKQKAQFRFPSLSLSLSLSSIFSSNSSSDGFCRPLYD